jgi:ribosomal protein S3
VIGRGGAGVTELKKDIEKIASLPVRINIEEVKRPEFAPKLVAENIARQLERRINFRRAVKMAALNTMNAGAKGIRIQVSGRLNNAEMARREKISKVRYRSTHCVPISTSTPHVLRCQTVVVSLVLKFGSTRAKGVTCNVTSEENQVPQGTNRQERR